SARRAPSTRRRTLSTPMTPRSPRWRPTPPAPSQMAGRTDARHRKPGVPSARMRPLVAAVTASLAILAPQTALASGPTLQPGVHVDPGSPAGKEYQIPVVGARSEGAGGGSAGS